MKDDKKEPSNKVLWKEKIETDYKKHRDKPGLPKEIFKEEGDKKAGYTLLIVLTGILMVLLIAWFLF